MEVPSGMPVVPAPPEFCEVLDRMKRELRDGYRSIGVEKTDEELGRLLSGPYEAIFAAYFSSEMGRPMGLVDEESDPPIDHYEGGVDRP